MVAVLISSEPFTITIQPFNIKVPLIEFQLTKFCNRNSPVRTAEKKSLKSKRLGAFCVIIGFREIR